MAPSYAATRSPFYFAIDILKNLQLKFSSYEKSTPYRIDPAHCLAHAPVATKSRLNAIYGLISAHADFLSAFNEIWPKCHLNAGIDLEELVPKLSGLRLIAIKGSFCSADRTRLVFLWNRPSKLKYTDLRLSKRR